jgi:hypothetical protein
MPGSETSTSGDDFKFGSIHTPLEPFKEQVTVIGGLDATSSMPPPG